MGAAEVASLMVGAGAPAVGAPAGRSGIVGAGAPGAVGAPAVRRGMVGAGAGGRGAAEGAVAVGGPPGIGGRTGGASGTVAEGTAGGASAAFRVTRTVSFFRGTLDVCLDGLGDWFSLSLMRAGFSVELLTGRVRRFAAGLSNPQRGKSTEILESRIFPRFDRSRRSCHSGSRLVRGSSRRKRELEQIRKRQCRQQPGQQ